MEVEHIENAGHKGHTTQAQMGCRTLIEGRVHRRQPLPPRLVGQGRVIV